MRSFITDAALSWGKTIMQKAEKLGEMPLGLQLRSVEVGTSIVISKVRGIGNEMVREIKAEIHDQQTVEAKEARKQLAVNVGKLVGKGIKTISIPIKNTAINFGKGLEAGLE